MIIKELKENEPINIKETIISLPPLPSPDGSNRRVGRNTIIKDARTIVYTDGNIKNKDKQIKETITSIVKTKSQNVYYENYSYIITYSIEREFRPYRRINGWFEFVKNISIYVKNRKDKETLKKVKKLVKTINRDSINVFGEFYETYPKKIILK